MHHHTWFIPGDGTQGFLHARQEVYSLHQIPLSSILSHDRISSNAFPFWDDTGWQIFFFFLKRSLLVFFAFFPFLFLGDRETWKPILWEVLVGHFQQEAEAGMTVNSHLISYWKHTPIIIISERIWIIMIKPTNDKRARSFVGTQRLLWGERPICLSLETQDQCLLSAARTLSKRKKTIVCYWVRIPTWESKHPLDI